MKTLVIVAALLATTLTSGTAQAGIFGRRWPQSQQQSAQQSSGYRSNSYQPTFPFSSRSDPRDWHEAHRGYGIKIRGW